MRFVTKETIMIYRLDNFIENSINPITNQPYNDSWIIWQLTDSKDYKLMVGSFNGCAYSIKFSRFADGGRCLSAISLSSTLNTTKI